MKYYTKKTPILESGLACSFMEFLLTQIESDRGLTTFIEHHGSNGRWLKPTEPADIRWSKLIKILELKVHYQNDDEFLDDWNAAGKFLLRSVRRTIFISHHRTTFHY